VITTTATTATLYRLLGHMRHWHMSKHTKTQEQVFRTSAV